VNIPRLYNETALLKAIVNGDEQAFARLSDYYNLFLCSYVFRFTHSEEIAEEIVQDIFLKIWMSHEVLAGIKNFRKYLYIVFKNNTLSALRKMSREKAKQKAYFSSSVTIVEETSPAEELARKYYLLIDKAIELLPDHQQKIYLLNRRQKRKYEEITQEMGISYETVKRHMRYASLFISDYVRSHMEPCLIALLLATPVAQDTVYLN
jgi:RNA polymerase sigma-70 factor (ECF subfamily)